MLPSLPVSSFFLLTAFGAALASCMGEKRAVCKAVHGLHSYLVLLCGHGVCFVRCFAASSMEECLHAAKNLEFVLEEDAVQESLWSLMPVSYFVLCEITPLTRAGTAVTWK